MKGDLQYQFKGTVEHKEINRVLSFSGFYGLIVSVFKASKKRPDKILIFFNKN